MADQNFIDELIVGGTNPTAGECVYPNQDPWGSMRPYWDFAKGIEGFVPQLPRNNTPVSKLPEAIRSGKQAFLSCISVRAVFSSDVEDGDLVRPVAIDNSDVYLETVTQLADAMWVPVNRVEASETDEAGEPPVPAFWGIAYKNIGRVLLGPAVAHPKFKFKTGDTLYAATGGKLTTENTGMLVGFCLAPGKIYIGTSVSESAISIKALQEKLVELSEELSALDAKHKEDIASLQGLIDGLEESTVVIGGSIDTNTVTSTGSDTARTLAERFADIVNVRDFGARGDGITDDSDAIQKALSYSSDKDIHVYFPYGKYITSKSIYVERSSRLTITGKGAKIFNTSTVATDAVVFSGTKKQENIDYTDGISQGSMLIDNVFSDVEEGDLIHIETTHMLDTDYREDWHDGILVKVNRIDSEGVHLSDPIPFEIYPKGRITAVVTDVVGNTATIASLDMERDKARVFCYIGGDEYNKIFIVDWNNDTKKAKFSTDISAKINSGDSIDLVWRTTCTVFSPIQLGISGISIDREVVTNGITYRGLRVYYARDSIIDDVDIRHFSESNIRLDLCYKTDVIKSKLYGANRIYTASPYTSDGIGYGVHHAGCSLCRVALNDIKACRGGWTSAYDSCRTYASVIQNNTFTAPEGLSYLGEKLSPEISIDDLTGLKGYAFGAHGCGLDCVYRENTVINYPMGGKERGENSCFYGNVYLGTVYKAIYLNISKGGVIKGNVYKPFDKYKQTALVHVQLPSINMLAPVYIEDNIGVSEAAPLVTFSINSGSKNYVRNFHFRNNRVHLNGGINSTGAVGIGAGNNANDLVLDSSCSFEGNILTTADSIKNSDKYGFTGAHYRWTVDENDYVQIDRGTYYCRLAPTEGDIKIVLSQRYSAYNIDIVGVSNLAVFTTGIAFSNGFDVNPVTKAYTNSAETADNRVFVADSESSIVAGRNGIWLYHYDSGILGVRNTSINEVSVIIKINGLF